MAIAIRRIIEAGAAAWWALRRRALREHPEAFGSNDDEARLRPLDLATGFLRPDPDAADDFVLGTFAEGVPLGTIGFRRECGSKVRHKGAGRGSGGRCRFRRSLRSAHSRTWSRSPRP